MSFEHEAMNLAISLARNAGKTNNYPVAAVIATKDKILAEASSTLIHSCDPSAHPEMSAIRQACDKVQSRYMPDAYLFTTLEPCPMCTSTAIWAKMKGIYFATNQNDAYSVADKLKGTHFTFRQIDIRCRDIIKAGHPTLELYENFKRAEMIKIYDNFVHQITSP